MNTHQSRFRLLAAGGVVVATGLAGLGLLIGHATTTVAAPAAPAAVVVRAGSVYHLSGPITVDPGEGATLPMNGTSQVTLDLRACRSISVIFAPAGDLNNYVNAALHTFATAVPVGSHGAQSGVWASQNEETFLIMPTSAPLVTPYGWIQLFNNTSNPVEESRIDLFCAP